MTPSQLLRVNGSVLAVGVLLLIFNTAGSVPTQEFFPFGTGNGDSVALKGDDIFTGPLPLRFHFPFFNDTYNSLFVNVNGAVSFRQGISQFTPTCGAINRESAMIAPFWGDVHTGVGGDMFYRESTNRTLLAKATEEIQRAFPELWGVQSAWLFITTWENVAFYGASSSCGGINKRNTFQLTLATDGSNAFAIFYYAKLQWTTGTASGGDCSGLGGNPAKSGFDVGDGKTFYQLPGSCTKDVLDIAQTSNANSPGKWVFRVDSAFESSGCDSDKYETEKFRMTPSFVSSLGHVSVSISGPCLDTVVSAVCRFHDLNNSTTDVSATVISAASLAICEVPYLYTYGRQKLELIVQEQQGAGSPRERRYEGHLYVQEPHTDIVAVASPASGGDVKIDLTWDPTIFPAGTTFELILMEAKAEQVDSKWNESRLITQNLANSGSHTFVLPATSGFADLVAFQLKLTFSLNSAFSNVLLGLSSMAESSMAQARCEAWYKGDQGPPKGIEPCPPLLEQAERDSRFEVEIYTHPNISYYHPGAVASYRQRTPNSMGAGQQCVYQINGQIMVGGPAGGSADWSSPVHWLDILGHLVHDLLPWTVCCKQSQSDAHCRKYYEKRPSDGGSDYVPPRPGGGSGDPHLLTFDLANYSFNGVGEFWMIKSTNYSMQARMEPFLNSSGLPTPASVFTAFAMDDRQTRVQVQLSSRPNEYLNVLLEGDMVTFDPGQNRILTRSANIEKTTDNRTVTITFNTGYTFAITAIEDSLGLVASASDVNREKTAGLLGYFDGNPENDLRAPDGTITPLNATLEDIHYNFGLKWMIQNDESLFVYPNGKGPGNYSHPEFLPNFQLPDIVNLPEPIVKMCNGSRDCLFDFVVTGDAAFANQTRQEEETLSETVEKLTEEVPMCQAISEVANGYVETTNFFVGASVSFTCNPGYRLVGARAVYCIDISGSGQPRWSDNPPSCLPLKSEESSTVAGNGGGIKTVSGLIPLLTAVKHAFQAQ